MIKRGFTLVEIMLVMGIFAVLATISSISFFSTVRQTDMGSAYDILMADLKTKQANAMAGHTDTTWSLSTASSLPQGVTLATTFSGDTIVFEGGSGEILNFMAGNNTLSLQNDISSNTITLNRYGVIMGVE